MFSYYNYTGSENQNKPFKVTVSNRTTAKGLEIYNGEPTFGTTYSLVVDPAQRIRFIIISKLQQEIMTVCEVKVFVLGTMPIKFSLYLSIIVRLSLLLHFTKLQHMSNYPL